MSIYSFNPFRAASYLWRSRSVPLVPIPKENTYPLYKGTPSFVARWALILLSLDVMYMSSMVYECWEGGQLYHNPFKITGQKKPEDTDSPPPSPKLQKPVWTRLAFGAFHCGLGGLIAAFLLSQRASWIRTMTLVRPPSSKLKAPSRLYIEAAGHPPGYGHPFVLQDCALTNYSEAKNVMMVDTGREGKFAFYPLGATIGGKQMPATGDLAKVNMLKIWKALGGKIRGNTS